MGVARCGGTNREWLSSTANLHLKLEDVAAYLSVSVPQVYAMVRSGELLAIKIGGRGVWRVDRGKLDTYLENSETETAGRSHRVRRLPRKLAEARRRGPTSSTRKSERAR